MLQLLKPRLLQKGFTLIELLVVIAIIGIVAAILAPVIQGARKQAAISQNLSNLRNLQTANMLYSSEHQGRYVAVGSFNEDGEYGDFWHKNPDFLTKYLEIQDVNNWPEQLLSPWATTRNSDGRLRPERSYGYNFTGLGSYGTPSTSRMVNANAVSTPAQTLAFADALDWQIQMIGADRYVGNETTTGGNAIAYRYDGYAGVVYFDGHTDLLGREKVVENTNLWVIRKD